MYVAYRHNILVLVRILLVQKSIKLALCGPFLFSRHQNCLLLAFQLMSASIDDAFQLTDEILVALDVCLMLRNLKLPLGQLFAESFIEGISVAAHCRTFDAFPVFEANCNDGLLVMINTNSHTVTSFIFLSGEFPYALIISHIGAVVKPLFEKFLTYFVVALNHFVNKATI